MVRRAPRRLLALLVWLTIGLIAYATLTKIGFIHSIYFRLAPLLPWLPLQTYVRIEHLTAFGILGALLAFTYRSAPSLYSRS